MEMYDVKFKFWWWWHFNPWLYIFYFFYRKIIHFSGKGMVYLTDSSLVIKGASPKFYIPVLTFFYHRLLCNQRILTIPYSVIENYKSPSIIRRFHSIVFRQPDGKKAMVVFKIKRDLSSKFIQSMVEYLSTVHTIKG